MSGSAKVARAIAMRMNKVDNFFIFVYFVFYVETMCTSSLLESGCKIGKIMRKVQGGIIKTERFFTTQYRFGEESHQKKVEFLLTTGGFGCIFASFLCINIKA